MSAARHPVMLGTVPTGTLVSSGEHGALLYRVMDRWQDTVTVRSEASGRRYTWPDDRYVVTEVTR